MTQIIKDMLDPVYFATVVPVGLAYLGLYWRKDSKQIKAMQKERDG